MEPSLVNNVSSLDPRSVLPERRVFLDDNSSDDNPHLHTNLNSQTHNLPPESNLSSLKKQFFQNIKAFLDTQSLNTNSQSQSQSEILELTNSLVNIVFKPILS